MSETVSIKEWVSDAMALQEKLMQERMLRIDEGFKAVKDQTALAFSSSEKAIIKAEASQKAYNERSNEFRGALDDAQQKLLSIARFDDFIKGNDNYKLKLEEDIRSLRESRTNIEGKGEGSKTTWAIVGTLLGILLTLIGMYFKN